MRTPRRRASLILALLSPALLGARCAQERRDFRENPPAGSPNEVVKETDFDAGGRTPPESTVTRYGDNAYALAQGQRLFHQMNCVGCHFHGGGGIGPALMDDQWIYGSDPSQIFNTIVEGRPNGMPSFRSRLGNQEVWQLVAYVRSLSGLDGQTSSSSREDHMKVQPTATLQTAAKPKVTTIPKPPQ